MITNRLNHFQILSWSFSSVQKQIQFSLFEKNQQIKLSPWRVLEILSNISLSLLPYLPSVIYYNPSWRNRLIYCIYFLYYIHSPNHFYLSFSLVKWNCHTNIHNDPLTKNNSVFFGLHSIQPLLLSSSCRLWKPSLLASREVFCPLFPTSLLSVYH